MLGSRKLLSLILMQFIHFYLALYTHVSPFNGVVEIGTMTPKE